MYTVEMYQRLRRACHVDGMSLREAARQLGLHHNTVKKALQFSLPPGYQRSRPVRRPKPEGYTGLIDAILSDDKERPKKHHHTAKRIHERLRDEYGFAGGYTTIKDYVQQQTQRSREMFIPLLHPSGHAQADFGEALVVIAGVEQKAHFLAVDLPHSDACFVKAYPAETSEAFCESHNAALAFFGGVPLSILYDNTKIAVERCRVSEFRLLERLLKRKAEFQPESPLRAEFSQMKTGRRLHWIEGLHIDRAPIRCLLNMSPVRWGIPP